MIFSWLSSIVSIFKKIDTSNGVDGKKNIPWIKPNSSRWLTLSWKLTIQNLVTSRSKGSRVTGPKNGVIFVKNVDFCQFYNQKVVQDLCHKGEKFRIELLCLFVLLTFRFDITYNHLPGDWKVADRKNWHYFIHQKNSKRGPFFHLNIVNKNFFNPKK